MYQKCSNCNSVVQVHSNLIQNFPNKNRNIFILLTEQNRFQHVDSKYIVLLWPYKE